MKIASLQVKANDLGDFREAHEHLEKMLIQAAKEHDLLLVPECAFPSYFIHPKEGDVDLVLSYAETYLERIKEIAKKENVYIAYGSVEKDQNHLYNTAFLIDRSGKEVVKKRKSFLWHFDSTWFSEGEDLALAETEFGKVALIVCADARMPEMVRLAALEGAQLIIDLANLTATGPDISSLQNAQSAYMLSIRALENQVWLAVSDKWGVEANSITYTGRSGVYSPDGTCLYQAASDRDEIVSVDIPTDPSGKISAPSTQYAIKRRPELYGPLCQDLDQLRISSILREKHIPSDVNPYITNASGEFDNMDDFKRMIRRLVNHGSEIICMPPTRLPIHQEVVQISELIPPDVVVIATFVIEENNMTTFIIDNNGILHTYNTLHQDNALPNETITDYPVYNTKWGNIALMHNEEALLPEWPRLLMLLGADCIIWPNQLSADSIVTNLGRTRAAESRVFIVSTRNNGISQIIDPNGGIIASTLNGRAKHACGSFTPFLLSRIKDVVPGTNVVTHRHPQNYRTLAE